MTAKEKAKKLVLKFAFKGAQHEGESKTFALITVDEILNIYHLHKKHPMTKYYSEVRKEIEKL